MASAEKIIAVSQRVDVSAHGERRDALDQRWASFLKACGFGIVPVPNIGNEIGQWLERIGPAGIILSGGNDLADLGGDAPERDITESVMIGWSAARAQPLIGVCRGMQMLAHVTGGTLDRCEGHVARRHAVTGASQRDVNSFHNWCIRRLSDQWRTTAVCADGTIEAMRHVRHPHIGVMWHPEREETFHAEDIATFRQHFGSTS